MFRYSAPPVSAPLPRLTARSMLSFGTDDFFAFWMASKRVGLPAGSPPPVRAATSIVLISLANIFERLASTTAFLCFVVAHLEWPLMTDPSRSRRSTGAPARRRRVPDGKRWRAAALDERRRSYRGRRRLRRERRSPGPRPRPRPSRPTGPG